MPSGRYLTDQRKRELVAALATRLDVSVPELAREYGLNPATLHTLSAKHNINRPVGKAAPCRKKPQAVR